jgi:uncharacterized protein YukE
MAIKINTVAVLKTSEEIVLKNCAIRDDFNAVRNAMNRLQRNWSGSAADQASMKFLSLDKTFSDNRYKVIKDFAWFLERHAGNRYEETEKIVSGAAAAFK